MREFTIEAKGEAREVYYVFARDEEHARQLFNDALLYEPILTEVTGSEITSITEGRLP